MKPINYNEDSCDKISSNCVIWQGPDIPCIKLCKGDSVSTVIYKLGIELCEVLDILDINSYDITCLNLGDCGPKDFQALIQLLINKICELNDCCDRASTERVANNAPTGTVTIAPCFYYKNPQGDQVTYMTIEDYAVAMGNKICGLVGQITTINSTLVNHDTRITILENTPAPTLDLPYMQPICVLPDPARIDAVLIALEQQFCELRTSTGLPNDIYNAILMQCVGLTQSPMLNGVGNMNTIPGWNSSVTNLAAGITNMWITLCDMRAAIKSIQEVCCTSTTCDDLDIQVQGVLTDPNNLVLYFTGSYPLGFNESNPGGSMITITDAGGGSMTILVPIIPNLNSMSGYNVPLSGTPINGASNLIVTVPLSFTDGVSQCTRVVTEAVMATSSCPAVLLTPSQTTINWLFTYLGGAASISTKLYDATGTVLISTQVNVVTGAGVVSGTFTGLVAGIQYKVRNEITIAGAPDATICAFASITTSVPACIPPSSLTATLIL